MVLRVLHRNFSVDFVDGNLLAIIVIALHICGSGVGGRRVNILLQLRKVDLEDTSATPREIAHLPPRHVVVALHGHQMTHVLVLLLSDLVARQQNKVLFVNDIVEEQNERAHIGQIRSVELQRSVLLNVKQIYLSVID